MSGATCDNCGAGHGPDDIFCENCGYDFITGSLPREDEQFPYASAAAPVSVSPLAPGSSPAPAPPESAPSQSSSPVGADIPPLSGSRPIAGSPPLANHAPAPPVEVASGEHAVHRLRFEITVDQPYFETVVAEGELDLPDPLPQTRELELAGTELHIGRTSESRAIHPDLDIAELTGDPAVSSRHAVIRVGDDGALTITDVGSTNGTFVGSVDADPIQVGQPVILQPGTPVFVGAWTRLCIPGG